jgi:hypothetical protein
VWLDELSRREGTAIDLATVPANEWDSVAALGFDVVWLMGVWERSPAGIAIALENNPGIAASRRVQQLRGRLPIVSHGYRLPVRSGGT